MSAPSGNVSTSGVQVPFSHLAKEFQEEIAPLVVDGSISFQTTVRENIATMPDAFLELFDGGNTGKMIVKL